MTAEKRKKKGAWEIGERISTLCTKSSCRKREIDIESLEKERTRYLLRRARTYL